LSAPVAALTAFSSIGGASLGGVGGGDVVVVIDDVVFG
jgi:hypothetical protein